MQTNSQGFTREACKVNVCLADQSCCHQLTGMLNLAWAMLQEKIVQECNYLIFQKCPNVYLC